MRRTRALITVGAIAMTAATGVAATTVSAAPASNSQPPRHGELLSSNLVGRPTDPNLTVAIEGVPAGAVPWALSRGSTRVQANGRVTVKVNGLVITGTNSSLDRTTGPVKAVVASVACDGMKPTIASTDPVPLSPRGDARIDQRVTLPAVCLAPIVLVRANNSSGPWIAASGF
jgi:hypothetical protein